MKERIAQALAVLPTNPGVYIMHDETGKVIYVGKAINLKNRVRSYFRNSSKVSPKVQALVTHVEDIETIVTASEIEALILECNLIKKYKPHYNISLKDDKTYPYLKVTTNEDFPRLFITRKVLRDGCKYFGPYADAGALHTNLKLIRSLFPLRHCRTLNAKRPCLQYHLKRCLAPCTGNVSKEEYGKLVNSACMLMDGKITELRRDLKGKMEEASEELRFEEAAKYRDTLRSLEYLNEEQKASTESGDRDVIGLARDETGDCVQVFYIRKGKILGRDNFFLSSELEEEPTEVLAAFLKQYYNTDRFVPKEILLNLEIESAEQQLISSWLTKKAEKKIELLVPQKGMKKDLVKMAEANALKFLQERTNKAKVETASAEEAARQLQEAIGLKTPLARMDCFDISHTQGKETVASMVVFRYGAPSKKDYRRYKIKSAEGKPDDFKSMQEVVYRRYKDMEDLPSLVVIDGGKGQLSSALEIIRGLGLDKHELPVIGLAKREEEIFKEGEHTSIMLDKMSPALHLIQHLRDEAHRFAITYHRKLRAKRNLVSVLDHIEGIGPKRREALWKRFSSLDAMREASVEDLAAVEGMSTPAAQKVKEFLTSDIVEKQDALNR